MRTVDHALTTYNEPYVPNMRKYFISQFWKIDILTDFDPIRKCQEHEMDSI